jgi:hypothetical protein
MHRPAFSRASQRPYRCPIRAGGDDFDLPPDGRSRRLYFCNKGLGNRRIVGIDEHGKARGSRQQLVQEPEPLCRKLHANVADPGEIAARPVEAGNEAQFYRVGASNEDNGNRRGRRLGCERRGGAGWRDDDCHSTADQIGGQFRQSIVVILRPSVFDSHVLAVVVAGFAINWRLRGAKFGFVFCDPL